MRRSLALLLLLILFCFSGRGVSLLFAQEDEDDNDYNTGIAIEDDWDGYISDLYSRGDQTFTISLGLSFPTLFFNNGTRIKDHHFNPPVGGTGSLAYTYFFSSHFFLGGEIGAKINGTLAKNTAFIIPIGLRTGFQFVARRFEFPFTAGIGMAPQRYLNFSYVGLYMKGSGGAYYRFSPDWSFGLNFDWSWYPQWPREDGKPVPAKNMDAHFIGLILSARYHF